MSPGHDPAGLGYAEAADRHVPVMLAEVMDLLAPAAGGIFIDGTFGAGGYTRAILGAGAFIIATGIGLWFATANPFR